MSGDLFLMIGIFALASCIAYYEGRRNRREELCKSCMERGIQMGIVVGMSQIQANVKVGDNNKVDCEIMVPDNV